VLSFAGGMKVNFSHIDLAQYTYHLPAERIALYPKTPRDASLQLVYKDQQVYSDQFLNIHQHLPENSLLVFNDTKVINARLFGKTETGAEIEFFILNAADNSGIEHILNHIKTVTVKCLIGNAKRFKGALTIVKDNIELHIELLEKKEDYFIITLNWQREQPFHEIIELFGETPLPPYINRKAEEIDKSTYQTTMAKEQGSVAAPTAALHFSEKVLQSLTEKKILQAHLTLHVGAGTFLPIKTEKIAEHYMHTEDISVSLATLHLLKEKADDIVAVGTTSLRTLETLYWCAQKIKYGLDNIHFLEQWLAYDNDFKDISYAYAMEIILDYCKANDFKYFQVTTQILIMPGYHIKSAKALVTNFHQPGSTLLLLVAAFIGEAWRQVYDFALSNDYRFLSYGDSSLLFRK
jgi:S-adenosylmethionine:tRNA ribosyltransferase-isomerase